MYPRVLALHGHDLTRMNVHPGRRDALMRGYHQPVAATPTADAVETAPHRPQGHVIAADAGAAPRYQCPGCAVREKTGFRAPRRLRSQAGRSDAFPKRPPR